MRVCIVDWNVLMCKCEGVLIFCGVYFYFNVKLVTFDSFFFLLPVFRFVLCSPSRSLFFLLKSLNFCLSVFLFSFVVEICDMYELFNSML